MKILIISSAQNDENTETNNRFVKKLNLELGAEASIEWHNYTDIGIEMDAQNFKSFIVSTGQELKDFQLVYFKSIFRHQEQAAAIVEYLDFHKVKFVGKELREYIASYKLTQMARLSREGLPIPHTIYLPNEHYLAKYDELKTKLGTSFIFKAIQGSTGDDNYLVENKQQLKTILSKNNDKHYIAQAFIPNNSDLRVLIVGNQPKLVIKRSRSNGSSHLNNTSQGGLAELIPLDDFPAELKKLTLAAHDIMKRDVSGVDIMLEQSSGQPYILEVNASPQIASGAFEAEKLKIYTEFFKSATRMKPSHQTLRGVENVQFPELSNESVPARIDTGARTSAIWASDITKKSGKLMFRLFDGGSQYYNGETISSSDYTQLVVTNSSGVTETRYAVKLLVKISDRNVRATFTLANRSSQVYPVLIGRNVLRNKFIVNVGSNSRQRKDKA